MGVELRDVRPRGERLLPGAAQHEHPHRRIGVERPDRVRAAPATSRAGRRSVVRGFAAPSSAIPIASSRSTSMPNSLMRRHDNSTPGGVLLTRKDEPGVAQEVAHDRPRAGAAEAAQAMAHVGEEALPRLLAVSGDIDPDVTLALDHPPRGLRHQLLELERVHRLAAALADERFGERVRAWYAARVGRQDARASLRCMAGFYASHPTHSIDRRVTARIGCGTAACRRFSRARAGSRAGLYGHGGPGSPPEAARGSPGRCGMSRTPTRACAVLAIAFAAPAWAHHRKTPEVLALTTSAATRRCRASPRRDGIPWRSCSRADSGRQVVTISPFRNPSLQTPQGMRRRQRQPRHLLQRQARGVGRGRPVGPPARH